MVSGNQRLNKLYNTTTSKLSSITNRVRQWWTNQKMVHSATSSTNAMLDSTLSRLKAIAATYLGIMGTKAVIKLSDTMTSSENKLNYTNATALGDSGYNADGSYSAQTINATKETMDKMYASSQKVRMSYSDMMSTVSKNMALAGDAFQNNTDNAIRFQEIMAEAYAIGGASAQEMHSSMYQMIQALGSGVLQGDELRSVREGAPLAYKAIEEFAQGVYKTDESLKKLASDGKITSDIVVAAMLDAEGAAKKIDEAFANTSQTFDQAWTQIVNAAQYAFKPVSEMLRTMLNDAIDNGMIQKVESFMVVISKAVQIIVTVIGNAINWFLDNWSWIQNVLIAGIATLTILMIASTLIRIGYWILENWYIILIAAAIFTVIYALMQWQQGAIGTTQLILVCFGVIIAGILVLAAVFHSMTLVWIAAILAVLAIAFMFFEEICGGAMWLGTAIWNLASYITRFIFALIYSVLTIIQNVISFIFNIVLACGKSIMAIATNIGIAFQNAWIWAKNSFWEFIADVIDGVAKLAPVINGIAKLIGKDGVDFGGLSASMRSRKSEYKSYVSVGNAWSSGVNTFDYASVSDAWSKGWNTSERKDLGEAYDKGYNWGAGVKANINEWGAGLASSLGDQTDSLVNLDKIGQKLGLNFDSINGSFPAASDPAHNAGGSYTPPSTDDLLKSVGNIGDDTASIADSMDLSAEDLEYLRRAAELDWKKEYTVAQITVDMTNNNNIGSDNDLDGIVTRLTDKLYEELTVFADGVYA